MKNSIGLIAMMLCFSPVIVAGESHGVPYMLVKDLPPILIDPVAETIGHTWTRSGGVWEQHLIQKFYGLLPKDEPIVVFDLGAQTGAFSLLAKFLPLSTWHAFEPIAEAAEALRTNLTLNTICNVSVHQVAVSNVAGTTKLTMPDRANWGLSTIGSNPLRFTPHMSREITAITLDMFVETNNIPRVHFMKLDTEGSELYILRGAQKLITRDHPIMIMEYNETNMQQCGVRKQELNDFLTSMGYTWHLVSSEDILCVPRQA